MLKFAFAAKLAAASTLALSTAALNAQEMQPTTPSAQTETPATQTDPATDQSTATAAPAAPQAATPTTTIVDAATSTPELSTLASAVQAAGLVETLKGPGPFTVFAPTNNAFGRLAPGTVDTLLKPENKALLTDLLTYHVIAGEFDAAKLVEQMKANNNTAQLTTVEGQPITATLENNAVILTDANGNKSYVTQYDVKQANGVVHIVNGVLIPKQDAQAAEAAPSADAPAETAATTDTMSATQ